MVCYNLIAQKLTKKIGSLEMDFLPDQGPVSPGHQPNNMTFVGY